jgi:hypothetical protein
MVRFEPGRLPRDLTGLKPNPAGSLWRRRLVSHHPWRLPLMSDRRNHGGHARPHPPPIPRRQDCWHVYYGDIHVGTIARRTGCPVDVDQWEWRCGFYPGIEPGRHQDGTAIDFASARADFEAAWRAVQPTLTDPEFQRSRDQRDATAWKYAMWNSHMKMPTQMPNGRSRCFCGADRHPRRRRPHPQHP